MELISTSSDPNLHVFLLIGCVSVWAGWKKAMWKSSQTDPLVHHLFFLCVLCEWSEPGEGLCQVLLNRTSEEAREAGSEAGRGTGTTESVEVSGGR